MIEWTPLAVAAVTVVGTLVAAWMVRRKSESEADQAAALADKAAAEATTTIVGSAADVVAMLREQMADLHRRLDRAEARIVLLETEVGTWEIWAERVLDLLDRALGMMATDQAANLRPDVEAVHNTRPPKRRRGAPPEETP